MSKFATTKMSSKGQVVIPEEIRDQLGLYNGEQFLVIAEKGVVILKAIEPPSMKELKPLIAKARKAAKENHLTKEEIDKLIKEIREK